MAEIDNIPEMRPSFDNIRRQDEGGNEYWSSRDLCAAMGYSAYWKFQRVIDKAIKVAGEKGMNVDDHFNQAVDMVRIGSGSFRKVNIFRLSRMACMIVAENANVKKVLVQQARDYFTRTISINELMQNSLSSNILLYKTAQGEARIEVIFNSETFWMSQKRMADTLGVDEQTVSLWERSKRRPAVAAERMLRLLYLEFADGTTKLAEMIERWNDTDRQEDEEQRTTAERAST